MIKQVNPHSIQVHWGLMGFDAWNTFVPRVEHPYIVGKSENIQLGKWVSSPHACQENCMLQIAAAKPTCMHGKPFSKTAQKSTQ